MKNIWKYITGFFTFVVGLLVLSGKKNKKVKEIKGKIDNVKSRVDAVNSELRKVKNKDKVLKQTLKSKKKALKEIEKSKYKKKDIGAKEASNFLKKYSKRKK
tara:strand:- start:465 stop:770 length:306 start_codon:yes stop_codon:yes gene_type:complete